MCRLCNRGRVGGGGGGKLSSVHPPFSPPSFTIRSQRDFLHTRSTVSPLQPPRQHGQITGRNLRKKRTKRRRRREPDVSAHLRPSANLVITAPAFSFRIHPLRPKQSILVGAIFGVEIAQFAAVLSVARGAFCCCEVHICAPAVQNER